MDRNYTGNGVIGCDSPKHARVYRTTREAYGVGFRVPHEPQRGNRLLGVLTFIFIVSVVSLFFVPQKGDSHAKKNEANITSDELDVRYSHALVSDQDTSRVPSPDPSCMGNTVRGC